jgi:hypothetical protein
VSEKTKEATLAMLANIIRACLDDPLKLLDVREEDILDVLRELTPDEDKNQRKAREHMAKAAEWLRASTAMEKKRG